MLVHARRARLTALWALCASALCGAPAHGANTELPMVQTVTALSALPTTQYDTVLVATPKPTFYQSTTTACTINSGAGDNHTQVRGSNGLCWVAPTSTLADNRVDDFGAKCDGVTDDTLAVQAAVASFNANSLPLVFPPGSICIVNVSAGPFVIARGGIVNGFGIPGAGGAIVLSDADLQGSSVVRDVSGSANPIFQVVTAQSVSWHDLMIDAVPAKPSAYAVQLVGVTGTAAYQRSANFERMQFRGNGIDVAYAVDLRVDRSVFLDYAGCAINEQQRNGLGTFFDFGDWRVTDSLFFDQNVTTGSAFCHKVGSGGTFLSNTVNGGQYGYFMAWAGSHSEETRIIGNIMDQQTKASVAFTQATPGSDYAEIIVANNNFSTQVFAAGAPNNPQFGSIYVGKGIPANFDERWIKLLHITGNTFNNCFDNSQGAPAAIWVRDGDNVLISENSLVMNGNVQFGPCQPAMNAGVSFIQTEGGSYAGDANRSGVEVCSVLDNTISFAYQFFTGTAAYLPMYNIMAPLCVINDANYQTNAADPHIGYNRLVHKDGQFVSGTVAAFTTIAKLSPSVLTNLNATGTIRAVMSANTSLVARGVNDAVWWYQYTLGALTVGTLRADQTHDSLGGAGFPQFRLVNDGSGNILMQVGSSNGVAVIDAGHFDFYIEEGEAENVATTFYWTLTPASP